MKAGDGSGIHTQIPYPLFRIIAEILGHCVENKLNVVIQVLLFLQHNAAEIEVLAAEVTDMRGGCLDWDSGMWLFSHSPASHLRSAAL